MTPERKLMALMAADTPPSQDPIFEIAVLEKLARLRAVERFSRMVAMIVVMSGLVVALGWAMVKGNPGTSLPMIAAVGASGIAALVVWTLRRA